MDGTLGKVNVEYVRESICAMLSIWLLINGVKSYSNDTVIVAVDCCLAVRVSLPLPLPQHPIPPPTPSFLFSPLSSAFPYSFSLLPSYPSKWCLPSFTFLPPTTPLIPSQTPPPQPQPPTPTRCYVSQPEHELQWLPALAYSSKHFTEHARIFTNIGPKTVPYSKVKSAKRKTKRFKKNE